MTKIRTFVAVEFSEDVKEEISNIQARLKRELGNLKWVPKRNLHLTLKFLGDVEPERIPEIAQGLSAAVQRFKPFSLGLGGLGAFPGMNKPKVIWMGLTIGRRELVQLQKAVESELVIQGFSKERRPYHPHLTLARSRRNTNLLTVGQILDKIEVQPTDTELIQSVKIMKSDLRPNGPVYTCLEKISLSG